MNGYKQRDFNEVKALYGIPEAWRDLGLRGEAGRSCRSPFREDRNPSFSVTPDGMHFRDYGTGESGDVGDFVALAMGWPLKEALEWCAERAGINHECEISSYREDRVYPPVRSSNPPPTTPPPPRPPRAVPVRAVEASETAPRRELNLEGISPGGREEWHQVARIRRLDEAAVEWAVELGVLGFGQVCGFPCWVLMEPGRTAEARRLDGLRFPSTGSSLGERKAHTLAGSRKDWPLGLGLLEARPEVKAVMVVEGGPDWLAALHFLRRLGRKDCLPVAMLGRTNRISEEALGVFTGRRVRFYAHVDPDGGGMEAACRWASQIQAHGGKGDFYLLEGLRRRDGRAVKDLNDAVVCAVEDEPRLGGLVELL